MLLLDYRELGYSTIGNYVLKRNVCTLDECCCNTDLLS